MANWIVEKDKNNFYHVREDENGKFSTKEEAIEAGKKKAKAEKTTLRIHKIDEAGYDSFDYSKSKNDKEKKAAKAEAVKKAKENVKEAKAKLKEAKKAVKKAKEKAAAKEKVAKCKEKLKEAKAKLKEAKKKK